MGVTISDMGVTHKPREFGLIDLASGEMYGAVITPWRSRIRSAWVKVFQSETTRLLMEHPELRGQSYKILLYLTSGVGWGNTLPTPAEVAMALALSPRVVYRAYAQLIRAQFVFRESSKYVLNPLVGWKGTDSGHEVACERWLGIPTSKPWLAAGRS